MPDTETARCIVCGKVRMVEAHEWTGAVVDLGEGIVVVGIDQVDPGDPDLFWPDGLALAACPIHSEAERMLAFAKYPPEHWIEGKPNAGN